MTTKRKGGGRGGIGWAGILPVVIAAGAVCQPPVAAGQEMPARDLEEVVDSLVESERGQRPVAGMVVAVVRGEDTLVMKGYGHADLAHPVPMTPDAVFPIASLTKQFTASAVLRLVEEGRISLDDPPGRHVKSFPDPSGAIRIRHLLNHTSGLPDIYELDGWTDLRPLRPDHEEARAQMVDLLADSDLHFPPGTSRHYSNAGYDFLGDLVEAVSGEDFGTFLSRELFDPVGLTDTSFCGWEEVIPDRVRRYDVEDGRFVNAFRHSPHYLFASGGLCSTARDLVRWSRALTSGEVLAPESLERMTTPEAGAGGYGYGIGVSDLAGHRWLNHNGSLPGLASQLNHYPEDELTVVVLSNSPAAVGQMADAIARKALGLPPRPVPAPPEGWRVVTAAGADTGSIHFRVMGAGVHTTSGASALYFHPDSVGRAPYEVGATFVQVGEPGSDEGLGLMLGGSDTASESPRHLLFRVRTDGAYSVEVREGDRTVGTLRPWTRHEAVVPLTDRGGRNELRAEVEHHRIVFRVNGATVAVVPAAEFEPPGGVAGLFVGRAHDVHIGGFGIVAGTGREGR